MPTHRFDVISPRKRKDRDGNEKTFWVKIGSAWKNDDKPLRVTLDALPLPDDKGEVTMLISEPREKGEAPARGPIKDDPRFTTGRKPASKNTPIDLDDEVPF